MNLLLRKRVKDPVQVLDNCEENSQELCEHFHPPRTRVLAVITQQVLDILTRNTAVRKGKST